MQVVNAIIADLKFKRDSLTRAISELEAAVGAPSIYTPRNGRKAQPIKVAVGAQATAIDSPMSLPARNAASERMKARWASGEMRKVMRRRDRKTANGR
jgi:hypothetical protein